MNSRIFTETERKRIRAFLDGKIVRNDPLLKMVRSRMKHFDGLAADVELYTRLREAISAVPAEKPLDAIPSKRVS